MLPLGPFIFLCLCYIYLLKQNNPLYVLISLIFLVVLVVLWFFSLGVELLSVLFLIIYIGAIAILFLFVIMLFDIRKVPDYLWPSFVERFFFFIQYLIFSRIRILFFFVYDSFIRVLFQSAFLIAALTLFLLFLKLFLFFLFHLLISYGIYFTVAISSNNIILPVLAVKALNVVVFNVSSILLKSATFWHDVVIGVGSVALVHTG